MIGLLRKDLYMTASYCRSFLLILAVFLGVGLVNGESSFFVVYPMIIGMMLPVSILSYDERFKWHIACDALPVSRAQAVSSKYILTLLLVGLVFVLTMLAQGIRLGRQGELEQLWELPGMLLPIGLVGPALLLPVIFRLGVEKGRIFYYVLVGLVAAAAVIFSSGQTPVNPTAQVQLPGAALVLGSLAIFALSWGLSIVLYKRREL
ncbi:MAG: ABC-2 transporter permease [Oscillospiraceae bacterium]|nr:ABC-2 transporter permease [Oscillospiraceae bacterium]